MEILSLWRLNQSFLSSFSKVPFDVTETVYCTLVSRPHSHSQKDFIISKRNNGSPPNKFMASPSNFDVRSIESISSDMIFLAVSKLMCFEGSLVLNFSKQYVQFRLHA